MKRLGPRVHISSALRDLHWLPVNFCIMYKLFLMMHAAHNHRCLKYISKLVTLTASIPSCSRLRSATSNRYEVLKLLLRSGKECSRLGLKKIRVLPVTRPCLFFGAFLKICIGFLKKYCYVTNLFITLKSTFVQFPLLIMFTIPLLKFSVRWKHQLHQLCIKS